MKKLKMLTNEIITSTGDKQQAIFVNETGFYSLILNSNTWVDEAVMKKLKAL